MWIVAYGLYRLTLQLLQLRLEGVRGLLRLPGLTGGFLLRQLQILDAGPGLRQLVLQLRHGHRRALAILTGGLRLRPGPVPLLNGLLQFPGAHGLHVVVPHKLLPVLRGHGKQGQSLGIAQISKRLAIYFRAEQAPLGGSILLEQPHEVVGCGGGVPGVLPNPGPEAAVGQHLLHLAHPPPDLQHIAEHGGGEGPDLRRDGLRRPHRRLCG